MKKLSIGQSLALAGILVMSSPTHASAQDDSTVYDKEIRVVHFEELKYPTLAKVAHIEGVVVIRVVLDDRGNVVKATAISGKEPLIPDCITNAKKWKFEPNARKMAVIVYSFTLPTADCGSVGSFFMLQGANLATITACPPTVQP